MANKGGLASFVGKNSRHGPTSVHGQPDSQTIRHVEAYMARVVPGSVHHDSVSRDMWATDVESIANTTTANMSDAVKSEEEPYQDVSIGTQMETEEVDAERNTDSDVEYSNDDDEDDDKAMVQPVGAVMTTVHHRVVAQAPVQPSLRSTNQPQYRPRGGQDGRVIERQSDPTISQKNEQKQSKHVSGSKHQRTSSPKNERSFHPRAPSLPRMPDHQARGRKSSLPQCKRPDRSPGIFGHSELGSEQTSDNVLIPDVEYKRNEQDYDYSSDALKKMTYQQLASESFDKDPRAERIAFPDDLASRSIEDRLTWIVGNSSEEECGPRLLQYFSSLSINEYEDAGDIIIEQISTIVKKFKGVRRKKRFAAQELEKEVAQREEAVRSRQAQLKEDLDRLKKQGQDVIQGQR